MLGFPGVLQRKVAEGWDGGDCLPAVNNGYCELLFMVVGNLPNRTQVSFRAWAPSIAECQQLPGAIFKGAEPRWFSWDGNFVWTCDSF